MDMHINKRDMILVAVIMIVAVIGLLCNRVLFSSPASLVEVAIISETSEKIVLETFSLDQSLSFPIETAPLGGESAPGINLLEIKDGHVWISEANCPNQDCVKKGTISRNGELLVCLPHRLTISIIEK